VTHETRHADARGNGGGETQHDGRVLTLYARTYCHLCDEMIGGLQPLQEELRFTVDVIDVDHNPALEARYGDLVPVLTAGDRELCHYHLDVDRVRAYFAENR
jgi:thioredoxin reductase (NADPH)